MEAWQEINGSSRIYAVVGDPIQQVQTPRLINYQFLKFNKNTIAVPFHVSATDFREFWLGLTAMPNLAGLGITVPHKVKAASLCDSLTSEAEAVGVANSIKRTIDGEMIGALFDGIGFVQGLGKNRLKLKDARVLLIGAGGAGRAIAYSLIDQGIAGIDVLDKDGDATTTMINIINRQAGSQIAKGNIDDIAGYNVLINASPVGLNPNDKFPVDLAGLKPACLVADIASLSRTTELLSVAQSKGCITSNGNDMLQAQILLKAGWVTGQEAGVPISN